MMVAYWAAVLHYTYCVGEGGGIVTQDRGEVVNPGVGEVWRRRSGTCFTWERDERNSG